MNRSFTDFITIIKSGDVWQILVLLLITILICKGFISFYIDWYVWTFWDIIEFDIYLEYEKKIKEKKGKLL
jgi:hypothetical protein